MSNVIKRTREVINCTEYHIQYCSESIIGNTCHGKRTYFHGAYINPHNKKWVFKITLGKQFDIYHFIPGIDKIDLRGFNIKCDDLKQTQDAQHLTLSTPTLAKKLHLVFMFNSFELACNDLLFENSTANITNVKC